MKTQRWEWGLAVILGLMLVTHAIAGAGDAQKISELHGNGETLWQFLTRLPASFEAQVFYGVAMFSSVGMLGNYTQRWLRNEITGSLFAYLFVDHRKATLLAASTALGTGILGITAGAFEAPSGEFVGWMNVMWVSLTNGFMWDAALNKGNQQEQAGGGRS